MKVVDGDGFLLDLPAEVVGGAVGVTALDAGTGEPSGEAIGIVVAAAGAFLEGGHPAKFGAAKNQGVFEESALFEVAQKRAGGLVEDGAVHVVLCGEFFVAVPVAGAFAAGLVAAIKKLHEAHALFQEPPGEDAVACVVGFVFRFRVVGAVHF